MINQVNVTLDAGMTFITLYEQLQTKPLQAAGCCIRQWAGHSTELAIDFNDGSQLNAYLNLAVGAGPYRLRVMRKDGDGDQVLDGDR